MNLILTARHLLELAEIQVKNRRWWLEKEPYDYRKEQYHEALVTRAALRYYLKALTGENE